MSNKNWGMGQTLWTSQNIWTLNKLFQKKIGKTGKNFGQRQNFAIKKDKAKLDISRNNVFHKHFYLPEVIIQVQNDHDVAG